MRFFKNAIFLSVFSLFSVPSIGQYVTVDDTYTALDLVQNVLINSPCANVSNITVSGDPFSPSEQSFGYFNSGTGIFPFSDGVVLSTARARRSEGPNNNLIDEGLTSWLGDTDLEMALNISGTYNATVLEFDFTPLTSKVSFDYIFASEEYQGTAPCRYSDGFAFLLREATATTPYQNLAVIPNTNTPVLVTSVHPDIPGSCPAVNQNYFGGYNGPAAPINFNGQTVVMTAQANVTPGVTYHIKLVIADHENIRYDSAIFLGGGSFKVGADLGSDRLLATGNALCQGENYVLDATEPGLNFYKWYKNNILTGVISPTYIVSTPGVYKVEVSLGASTCIASGEVTIEYAPLPSLTNTTLIQCDEEQDGIALFNLTRADNIIRQGDNTLGPVTYYLNLLAAQNQDTAQSITNLGTYLSNPRTVYASVTNTSGCSSIATVSLQISNNPVASFRDLEKCDNDGAIDGYLTFNLREADPLILQGLPAGLEVQYYLNRQNALLQVDMLPDNFTNNIVYQMFVYARIINGSDCYGIIPLHLFVNNNSPADFEDETVILCEDTSLSLEVAPTFNTYSWSNGGTTYQTSATQAGTYTVTVSDGNTCLATKKFIVVLSKKPQITTVDIDDFNENGSTVLIHYIGSGNYEFSIDGIIFQPSPYFADVAAGEYTARIRDKNGCGEDFQQIQVLNYPKYFTPNGDGYNDFWSIKNLPSLSNMKINIFDRIGKLVYQINSKQQSWDGKYGAEDLPSADYWFVIHKEDGKTIKGHFALKR